jgi:hypothetical protein
VTSAVASALRRLPILLELLLLCGAARPAHGSPEQDLFDAFRAYDRSDFPTVIRILTPLLSPRIQLSTQNQVLQANKLLGISYLFEKDKRKAEKYFITILSLRPDFTLDPLVDPPAAADFLEEVKRRNMQKLRVIQEREREEAKQKALTRQREEEARQKALLALRPQRVILRTVSNRPFWINFAPLGAGQFQNGHRRKGYLLLSAQLVLGGISLGTALSLRFGYPDGQVPLPEYDRARALAITQVTSGALCLGTVVYGIVDALVHYSPQTITEQRIEQQKFVFTPVIGRNSVGLGILF